MERFLDEIARLYHQHIIDAGKQPQALILSAFLITFVLVRWISYTIHKQRRHVLQDIFVGGTHIHHLVWGILLLLLTGYAAIAFDPTPAPETLAIFFGIGAALTLDEFALWLRLADVYWAKEGRWSVDLVILIAVVLALNLVGWPFWQAIGQEIIHLFFQT